ncbi:MAG: NAD(P)/FAD-dependent oxidoreductase [Ilumatobacteraceae bacterium]
MSSSLEHVVVVGASLAGLRACEGLRQHGFEGRLTLVGDEAEVPYDRPPLSKAFLAGDWDAERIRLRKPEVFESLRLDLRLGARAVTLDTAAASLGLADGSSLAYDGLVLATGATPRRLDDQPDVEGVLSLRTLRDSTELRSLLTADRGRPTRLVVVGAGFIGLEAASTARRLGCDVVVLEGAPAPLVRSLGADMGRAITLLHASHGVPVHCGVRLLGIEHDGTRVTGVRVDGMAGEPVDGSILTADVVLVGVGVVPSTDWLADSGLHLADGIVCDESLCAGPPNVFAAGDCVRWPNAVFAGHDDAVMRVEHWTNAAEQGAAAARNLLLAAGDEPTEPFSSVPFFWSDQYDQRVQFVGRAHGGDEVRVIAGTPGDGPFTALYGWQGRLRGALGLTMPKLVMRFRQLVAEQTPLDDAVARAAEWTSN